MPYVLCWFIVIIHMHHVHMYVAEPCAKQHPAYKYVLYKTEYKWNEFK